jgi:hypothetical protein
MDKKDWNCKECGEFMWGNLREELTEQEKKDMLEYIDCEEGFMIDSPKTEKEWETASLFSGETSWEMSDITDYCLEDFCEVCQKKLVKLGIFEVDEDD